MRTTTMLLLLSGCAGNIGGESEQGAGEHSDESVFIPAIHQRVPDREGEPETETIDCASMLVCDDFESTSIEGWQLVIDPPQAGIVEADTTGATSGNVSMRFVTTASDVVSHVQLSKAIAPPDNVFFGRMMLWATRTPTNPQHWNLIQGWGYVPGSQTQSLSDQVMYQYGGGGPDRALAAYYLNWTTDCFQPSTASLPLQRWVCVEWQFDGIANEMRFWLDGEAIDELTVTHPWCGDTWYAPAFERLDIGWYNALAEPEGPMEMWIDDVVVDEARIGCATL